ncbi:MULTISPECIES: hypothetical protein [Pandoraea]|uniref:hypothetical protein n=1 Tax=Pandoraea TaxID=93217 RepID=UPI001242CAA4|nr:MULTISPECIES: hypothetical protein [Pandoraea]
MSSRSRASALEGGAEEPTQDKLNCISAALNLHPLTSQPCAYMEPTGIDMLSSKYLEQMDMRIAILLSETDQLKRMDFEIGISRTAQNVSETRLNINLIG